MARHKTAKAAAKPKPQAPTPEGTSTELPPPPPEAVEIDRLAGVAPGDPLADSQAAPELGPVITESEHANVEATATAQAADMQAAGTAQILMMLVSKVAAKRWPGVEFTQDELQQSVAVLAPVIKKYDWSSTFLDRWKEEFAAGVFFAGMITAKQEQHRQHLERMKAEKPEPEGSAA